MLVRAININKIYKIYNLKSGQIIAVNNISIDINEKDYIAIVGESGSGKTSLISILGLLLSPDSGEIYYDKNKISRITDRAVSDIRKKIGFVFQNAEMIAHLNLIENVMLPSIFSDMKKEQYEEMIEYAADLLRSLKILDKYKSFPRELSGGQAQRACIARSLIHKPEILLADEPTGDLDSVTNTTIIDLFQKLNDLGITIFLVTHYAKLASSAKTIFKMKDGQIVNVYENPLK